MKVPRHQVVQRVLQKCNREEEREREKRRLHAVCNVEKARRLGRGGREKKERRQSKAPHYLLMI